MGELVEPRHNEGQRAGRHFELLWVRLGPAARAAIDVAAVERFLTESQDREYETDRT